MTNISKRDRFKTAPVIATEVNNIWSQPISTNTVKRRLVEFGYVGRVAKKKPLLRRINKRKRLVFAQNCKDWIIDQRKSVLWTNESKFQLFCNMFAEKSAKVTWSNVWQHHSSIVVVLSWFEETSITLALEIWSK